MWRLKKQFIFLFCVILLASLLRFYHLTSNPPSLYWDEASIGYNAYSILKTGRDEHGQFLPLFFESFGDWKMSPYSYLSLPFIFLFGLSELSVRLPSVISGVLTVAVFYLLIRELFPNNRTLALFSCFFLAISPWHIQFSRAAFEANVALFFSLLGFYLFILFLRKKNLLIFFSLGAFILSMYTYNQPRIFLPPLIAFLLFFYFRKYVLSWKKVLFSLIFGFILLLPLIRFTISPEGRIRFISESAFLGKHFENERLDLNQRGPQILRPTANFFYQRPIYYSYVFFNNYFSHFSPAFLFFRGDFIGRHSVQEMGQMYSFELVLILVGLWVVIVKKKRSFVPFLVWLLLAPLAASITRPVPHAVRSLPMIIPLTLFSAYGATSLWQAIKDKFSLRLRYVLMVAIFLIFLNSFLTLLHLYFSHYPRKYGPAWQEGYKEMVKKLDDYQEFDLVQISNFYGFPYIYVLFYGKVDPSFYQKSGSPQKIGRYEFVTLVPRVAKDRKNLYIAPAHQTIEQVKIDQVKGLSGDSIFNFWELK